MRSFILLIIFIGIGSFVFSQTLPVLPSKPKPKPVATQPKTSTAPKPKVIVKSNDRDGDGLTDAIDQCPDEKGPANNNGCPVTAKINSVSVTIGGQVWMRKNLDIDHYRNGDKIPQVTDPSEWANLTIGAWCYYENDAANGRKFGKLYNWYAVSDPRGLAPSGWHIPSDWEWYKLTEYLGGANEAGGRLKAINSWTKPNDGASNQTEFSAFPGGQRTASGNFEFINDYGYWWSFSEYDKSSAFVHYLNYSNTIITSRNFYKGSGFSVRCIKD